MKEVSFSLSSVNDGGYGFKINITFHPTMRGHCDLDIVRIADHEEKDEYVGVLLEHDDLLRLKAFVDESISESYKRLPEEDEDDEIDLSELFGDDD